MSTFPLGNMVACDCTQIPELPPCPHQPPGLLFDLPGPELAPEAAAATERTMLDALHARYKFTGGNGRRYAVAEHVRTVGMAGYGDVLRTADFVAMDLWKSGGWELHGHEVKVSRADWLRELRKPEKAAGFIPYMNRWWLVVPDRAMVRDEELPAGWGLMALHGPVLAIVRQAPHMNVLPMDGGRLAGLLRAVAKTAAATVSAGTENA